MVPILEVHVYLASVEVDQRQSFIQQAGTLKEMIGASRLISLTADWEEDIRKRYPGVEPVQLVSGVLRVEARDPGVLGSYLWELREKLELHGLSASIAVVPRTTNLDADLERLETAIRGEKDAKRGAQARPSLPYFAPCSMLPGWPANHWNPGASNGRALISWRAQTRVDAHVKYRGDRENGIYWGLVSHGQDPVEDMDDLAPGETDSYVGVIKADVDGLGRLLAILRYEALGVRLGVTAASAVLQFSRALKNCVTIAVQQSLEELSRREKNRGKHYPFLPLIVAGDDLLILCQRHLALEFVSLVGEQYRRGVDGDPVLQAALELARAESGKPMDLTLSFGVLFAKKGYPFEAMLELAEELIKGAKETRDREKSVEGYVDFHWLGSSAREDLEEQRQATERYVDGAGGKVMSMCTRPWPLSWLHAAIDAVDKLDQGKRFPSRKLHQLDPITRLGRAASELAFSEWKRRLEKGEATAFEIACGHFASARGPGIGVRGLWEEVSGAAGTTRAQTPVLELLLIRETRS